MIQTEVTGVRWRARRGVWKCAGERVVSKYSYKQPEA